MGYMLKKWLVHKYYEMVVTKKNCAQIPYTKGLYVEKEKKKNSVFLFA